MIEDWEDHRHPLLAHPEEYELMRCQIDSQEDPDDTTVVLTFRAKADGSTKCLQFTGLTFRSCGFCVTMGQYDLYLAETSGRGWEPGREIEFGNTDPGDVYFWAHSVTELEANHG